MIMWLQQGLQLFSGIFNRYFKIVVKIYSVFSGKTEALEN